MFLTEVHQVSYGSRLSFTASSMANHALLLPFGPPTTIVLQPSSMFSWRAPPSTEFPAASVAITALRTSMLPGIWRMLGELVVGLISGDGKLISGSCPSKTLTFPRHPSRSVHNTRIERLWYDVTHGFGEKWKKFFYLLESHHGLNPLAPAHIWLLHHLFLAAINEDAQEWLAL